MVNRVIMILLSLLLAYLGQAQVNRALFVAIDQYPAESGWAEIHATNDSKIVLPMLKQNGFLDRNINILLNQKATKNNIVKALNTICKQARNGDYVYIHFSCHGQQMVDDNGDELDGLDEAIIPYDAKRRFTKGGYEGENHLRDDELGTKLDEIRKKVGKTGNLTVVIDACHSGTGTRTEDDETYIRGTSYIFAPHDYEYPEVSAGNLNLNLKNDAKLSAITVFSACGADEVNYEYKDNDTGEYYGSLTYAFCKLVNSNKKVLLGKDFAKQLELKIQEMFVKKRWKQTPYFESTDEKKILEVGKQKGK